MKGKNMTRILAGVLAAILVLGLVAMAVPYLI